MRSMVEGALPLASAEGTQEGRDRIAGRSGQVGRSRYAGAQALERFRNAPQRIREIVSRRGPGVHQRGPRSEREP